jgi:hypothetical protein
MMAFSLFSRPNFEAKLRAIKIPEHLYALLAAMFSFSARFRPVGSIRAAEGATSENFQELAMRYTNEALRHCENEAPTISLLQAMVLTTFQQLIKEARGQAWRSVGNCVRIAYELQLHLVDSDKKNIKDMKTECDATLWSLEEERRRLWWTIWEFDVFASTVCRAPTAIDWSQNDTMLPVGDENWFAMSPQQSCLLQLDPSVRWKALQESQNSSPKAWFIVANSLMRNAQLLSNPKGVSEARPSSKHQSQESYPRREKDFVRDFAVDITNELAILGNSLYCFNMALPGHLRYRDDYLSFNNGGSIGSSRYRDCEIFSIHIMIQLTRFMIYHQQLFGSAPEFSATTPQKRNHRREELNSDLISPSAHGESTEEKPWKRYLDAADNILSIICNSSPDHIHYVNPFLASTIWLAAAVLLVYRFLGPSASARKNNRLIASKFDVLQATFMQYVRRWNMSTVLADKLVQLEAELRRLGDPVSSVEEASSSRDEQQQQQQQQQEEEEEEEEEASQQNDTVVVSTFHNSESYPTIATPVSLTLGLPADSAVEVRNKTHAEASTTAPYSDEAMQSLFDFNLGYNAELQGFLNDMFSAHMVS